MSVATFTKNLLKSLAIFCGSGSGAYGKIEKERENVSHSSICVY